jgi:hypothetical protein
LAENGKSRWQRTIRPRLSVDAYETPRGATWPEDSDPLRAMPSLAAARNFDHPIGSTTPAPDLSQVGGVLELTRTSYNELVKLTDRPGDSPDRLECVATVHGRLISLEHPVALTDLDRLSGLWGETGEVLIIEPLATWNDVKALPTWSPLEIIRFSNKVILAKCDGIDLRWTPEHGAEIIVDLTRRHVFQQVFGSSWGAGGEAKWIGRKGLIYQRRRDLNQETE